MDVSRIVIAIDGPAGAGKSTVSKSLAHRLGVRYLDTGAMYRVLALAASRHEVSSDSEVALAELLSRCAIGFGKGEPQAVFLNEEDVTHEIRTPEIGELASAISAHAAVRTGMVERQQQLVSVGGVVLEGRDATTVIAPDATLKVFMTASLEERARRRREEFAQKGHRSDFEEVRQQIENRDHRDINRGESPLKVADDAIVIETAGLTIEQVTDRIINLLLDRVPVAPRSDVTD